MLSYSGAVGSVLSLSRAARAAAAHDRGLVSREPVLVQQLAQFQLHQLQQLFVVHHVDLVQVHHDVRHFHLLGQQHVLTGLRHGAVGGGHYQDRAVYLRRTGDHVLDVVTVTGHVHMGVVPVLGLVLNMRNVDRDPAFFLFRGIVDRVECAEVSAAGHRSHFGDCRGQRGLAVVNVTHRAHIQMWLTSIEYLLCHLSYSL